MKILGFRPCSAPESAAARVSDSEGVLRVPEMDGWIIFSGTI